MVDDDAAWPTSRPCTRSSGSASARRGPRYAFEQELAGNRLARYLVAARTVSSVVAFAGIWLMADEAHITTFGVHPDWRRRGWGSA